MYRFTVPEYYADGFAVLILLDEEEIGKVSEVINTAPAGTQIDRFIDLLNEKLDMSMHELQELSKAIYSLIRLRVDTKEDASLIIKDLVNSFFDENTIEDDSTEVIDADKMYQNAEKNVSKIFQIDGPLARTIKGLGLLSENEKLFMNSRIVTDIRLLFDTNDSSKINGGVILHQLKLVYHQNNEEKQLFLSLDTSDLNELKDNILRALEKEKVIQQNNFSQNLEFINPIR